MHSKERRRKITWHCIATSCAPKIDSNRGPPDAVNPWVISVIASRRLPAACKRRSGSSPKAWIPRGEARKGIDRPSCVGLSRVRVEELLAIDLVVGNRFLTFRRNYPIDEYLAEFLLY